jgi:hypothetical protein
MSAILLFDLDFQIVITISSGMHVDNECTLSREMERNAKLKKDGALVTAKRDWKYISRD